MTYVIVDEAEALRRFSRLPGERPEAYERILQFHDEIRLYDGDLTVDSLTALETEGELHATIVAGNLTVAGTVAVQAERGHHMLLVTGDVRARRLYVEGRGLIRVDGDLHVEEAVFTTRGAEHDGGGIWAGGDIHAAAVVSLADSQIACGGSVQGWGVTEPDQFDGITDVPTCSDEALIAVVLDPWVDGPLPDRYGVESSLKTGEDPFRDQPLPARPEPPKPAEPEPVPRDETLDELEEFLASFAGSQRELLNALADRSPELQRLAEDTRKAAAKLIRGRVKSPKLTAMRDELISVILES